MRKAIGVSLIVTTLQACVVNPGEVKVNYEVTSFPPDAQIDVNGVRMGETPVDVSLNCFRKWVGVANAPGGWTPTSGTYEVTAYPPHGYRGYTQTKHIDPCQSIDQKNATIRFDLHLEAVSPKQKFEIINKDISDTISPDQNRNNIIKSLKYLRDQGLLTKEEYEEKILITFE